MVDYKKVLTEIWKHRKVYFYTLPIAFLLSVIYIFSLPRTYTTDVEVALESESSATGAGALGSLASTFGLDLDAFQSTDAITPMLYPDLMKDNGFVAKLLKVKVKKAEGDVATDYYTYLSKYRPVPWWSSMTSAIKGWFGKSAKTDAALQPYQLTKKQSSIMSMARDNITVKVDKKTGAVTISVKDNDPIVCKTMADSTYSYLQQFIIQYRTNKARKDVEYYQKLTAQAKEKYERQRQLYGSYADANMEVDLASLRSKQEDLENEMQLRYNTYTTFNAQLQAAIAKVQERTPAFMLIKGAEVPAKPSGPKRMLFVIAILALTFCGTSFYVLREIVK